MVFCKGKELWLCKTTNDCRLVNQWLQVNGINSESYYADIESVEKKDKREITNRFVDNKIKVLVASVAFGMGFDKPDIGFVIHFQKPGNVVAYYQQIGRAGRAIEQAHAILLSGEEDDAINRYFIEGAFPTEALMDVIINTIIKYPGIGHHEIGRYVNMKYGKIDKCLNYLLVNGDIYKEKSSYYKTPRKWQPDLNKSKEITKIRYHELKQMNEFIRTSDCYMEFIAKILDDSKAEKCGVCANCLGHDIFPAEILQTTVIRAQQFIREDFNIIEPRKKWPFTVRIDEKNSIADIYRCEEGRVLSDYGDAGWGKVVLAGKYEQEYFSDELVEASYELLNAFVRENDIKWVTNVSSFRRPELVKSLAERLANRLELPYVDAIEKIQGGKYQKDFNTSYLQFKNADDSFKIKLDLHGMRI